MFLHVGPTLEARKHLHGRAERRKNFAAPLHLQMQQMRHALATKSLHKTVCSPLTLFLVSGVAAQQHMGDVVSDLVLSFFCCCFYAPGDNRGVGTHHHHYSDDGRHAHHPPARNAAYHHRGPGSRMVSGRSRPESLQTVELKVKMCCAGCERVVRQALQNLRGVDRVDVNVPMQKVTVTGYVDRARVLQEVRRSGKKAEFWPSGGGGWFTFTSPSRSYYFRDDGRGSYRRDDIYNYRRHGHGRMREPAARGAGPVGGMCNDDDDDDACRIM